MEPSKVRVYEEVELPSSFVSVAIGDRGNESSTGSNVAQYNISQVVKSVVFGVGVPMSFSTIVP